MWLHPEDMPKWDLFVANHPLGSIYHLSAWKEVLERSFRHIEGHFLAIRDEGAGAFVAGFPLYLVKSRLTGNRLVSVPFATFCDPLISSPRHMDDLLPHVLDFYGKTRGATCIELRTQHTTSMIDHSRFEAVRLFKHHFLPLDRGLDGLRKSFHTNVRRKLSQALQSGMDSREGKTKGDLAIFYRLFLRTRKRLCLPPIPYRFFESMWDVLQENQLITLLITYHKGEPVGATLNLRFKGMFLLEYICDNEEFRNRGISQLLWWEAIKAAHDAGCETFSFGRTSCSNGGLLAFKEKWGTKAVDIPQCIFPRSAGKGISNKEQSWRYRAVSRLCERAPDSLYRLIGDFCYAHLG